MYDIYSTYIKELFLKNINYTIEEIIHKISSKIKNSNEELIYLTLKNMIDTNIILEMLRIVYMLLKSVDFEVLFVFCEKTSA